MNEGIPSELPDSLTYPSVNQSEVGSSNELTLEADGFNWISDNEDLYSEGFSESHLEKLRSILKATQGNVYQCEDVINEITTFDEDLSTKCETSAVTSLLPRNSALADAGNIRIISVGVDILVKYGINLLKPLKSPNWRSIKLSNGALKRKVQPLKGYEDVLQELGYTEKTSVSFDFLPSLQQPDIDKVAVVTADLLILRKELLQFQNQTHINKERFSKYFSSLEIGNSLGGSLSTAGKGIALERLERISNQQNDPPKVEDASKGNLKVKTPVPAPRRNIPQVSPREAKPRGQLQPSVKGALTETPLSTVPLTKLLTNKDDVDVIPSVGPIKHPSNVCGHGVHGSGENLLAKPTIFQAWLDPPVNLSAEGELAQPKANPRVPPWDPPSNLVKNQDSSTTGLQTPADFTPYSIEGNSKPGKAPSEVTIRKPPPVDRKNKPKVGFSSNQQQRQLSPQFSQPHPQVPFSAADFPRHLDKGNSRSQKEPPEVTTKKPPLVERRKKPQASCPLNQPQLSPQFVQPNSQVPAHAAGDRSPNDTAQPLPQKPRVATRFGSGTSVMNQEPLHKLIGKSVDPPSNEYKASPSQPQRQLPTGAKPTPFTVTFPPKSPVPGAVQPLQISGHVAGHVKQGTPSGIKQQGRKETPTSSETQSTKTVVSRPLEMKNDLVHVVAKYDFTAKREEDLTIKKSERLELMDDSESWWKVRKTSGNYEMGYVPSNYVNKERLSLISQMRQKTNPRQTSVASAPDSRELQKNQTQNSDIVFSPKIAVVKFKYEPQQLCDLALNEGDKVYVLKKVTDEWWFGEVSGKFGWFPSKCVSGDLDSSRTSSKGGDVSSSLSSGDDFMHGVVAVYSFQCRNSEELSFDQGERLDIIELPDKYPEWWLARNKEGQVGLVPRNFVRKVSDTVPVYSRLKLSNEDNVVVDSEVNHLDNSSEDLSSQECFHGKLSRVQSESVLENVAEGNFLVLESQAFKMRKLLREEHGLTDSEVDIVLALTEQYEQSECVQAVKAVGNNLQRALDYFQECATCFTHFGMHKLVALPTCECLICTECFVQNFSILAKTCTCMYKFSCSVCNNPNLEDNNQESYQMYFSFLGPLLKTYLEKKDYELYEVKLATWELMADSNFRWCAHGCGAGFINERHQKKIQCPECKKYQCFECKKQWLDQHNNISCERFAAWRKANDPEFQQQGLAAHLKENGINCPKCKMRYELAKGGCMHFKCPQCHHQFCCGCNLPFRTYPACNLLPSCKDKGLHAHHPRDCFYYLRDENCHDLQQLLQKHKVYYNPTSNPAGYNGERKQVCPVKEQQETPDGLVDAICGKPLNGQSGLCENHYKEYLVGLINQRNIDPVDIFGVKSLEATLRRNDRRIPLRAWSETNADYCTRLRQEVQQLLPLKPRNAQGVAGAT